MPRVIPSVSIINITGDFNRIAKAELSSCPLLLTPS